MSKLTLHIAAVNFHRFHTCEQLKKCLETIDKSCSYYSQTHDDRLDVVVFNSSRTDIAEVLQNYSYVKVIQLHHNFSTGESLNSQIEYGIQKRYKYLFRIDADDTVSTSRFRRQRDVMDLEKPTVVGGGLEYVNATNGKLCKVFPSQRPGFIDFLLSKTFLHPSIVLNLSDFATHDIRYPKGRIEDKGLVVELQKHDLRIYNDNMIYGTYHYNPNNRNAREIAESNFMHNLAYVNLQKKYRLAKRFLISLLYYTQSYVHVHLLRWFSIKLINNKAYAKWLSRVRI